MTTTPIGDGIPQPGVSPRAGVDQAPAPEQGIPASIGRLESALARAAGIVDEALPIDLEALALKIDPFLQPADPSPETSGGEAMAGRSGRPVSSLASYLDELARRLDRTCDALERGPIARIRDLTTRVDH